MNLLIVDTETNGIDPLKDRVVEVGAVLYSVEHRTTICQVSFILSAKHNDCERINGIPLGAMKSEVSKAVRPIARGLLDEMAKQAEFIVAHNAEFDRGFLRNFAEETWLCTCEDFNWVGKEHLNGKSLVSLALGHGIGIGSAHRALTDCQLLAAVFDRREDLPELIKYAARPKATYEALVKFADKDLAKDAGFRWNPGDKSWTRRMAIEDAEKLPFKVVRV